MSLLNEAMEACTLVGRTSTPDGCGGETVTWTDGAHVEAAFVPERTELTDPADKPAVHAAYTIITRRSVCLAFRQVIRRDRDGKTFRVLSDGDDVATPGSAWLDMRAVDAEEWQIPEVENDG